MKKVGVLAILLLLFPFAFAEQPWFLTANSSTIITNATFNISIEKMGIAGRVQYLNLNTTLYPKSDFRQNVLSNIINLDKNITDNWFYYEWMLPQQSLNFTILSFLETKDVRRRIAHKVKFPFNATKDVEKYIMPTNLVNPNDINIRDVASRLAEGEDDLFAVVFKLAKWTNENIKYLATNETVNNVKSASWVMENKIGVCDDISGLFIALCRSLKIPARYAGGIAYSNTGKEGFQSHGWAEVYFPGADWVPFDVVYGQFGYIDVSHVEFFKNYDPDVSTTILSYKSDNAKITLPDAKVSGNLKKAMGRIPRKIDLEVSPFTDNVGFMSYNYIDLKLNNFKDYYQATRIIFDNSEGIQFIDSNSRFIMLRPNETRHEYFIIKHNKTFTDRFFFTHGISASTSDDYNVKGTVTTKPDYQIFSYDTIFSYVKLKNEEQYVSAKEKSSDIRMDCTPQSPQTYIGYNLKIPCLVENTGNMNIEHLQLCIEDDCRGFSLMIGEKAFINMTKVFNETGIKSKIAEIKGKDITKSQMLSVQVYPEPTLEVINLNYSREVSFRDKFYLDFEVSNPDESPVRNVDVKLVHPFLGDEWKLKSFKTRYILKVRGKGKDLEIGNNNFSIQIKYNDIFGKNFTNARDINVRLKKLNFIQRIPFFVRDFLKWLDGLFG